ncbi:hypothetical protein NT6N_11090 [Oceaniferula spumae]|uniref:Three-Cys-motif partner protein TcmP n=1 Tax=Oceaniferula spumae TaxID=2979115 RepID=A0AAT9FJ86_9BACT
MNNNYLFDMDDHMSEHPSAISKKAKGHVWTEKKAQFIARYLRAFTYVTKHGTYIDAFAGPQEEKVYDNWAAKLVLENEPKWLRRFYLFEQSEQQIELIEELAAEHHEEGALKKNRKVEVFQGDMNEELPKFLGENPISEKQATFCLFDQRTKECDWETVAQVARHKISGNKIELFYFLAQGWVDRILTDKLGEGNLEKVARWLGADDWECFKKLDSDGRAKYFVSKFLNELGYAYSKAYPIFEHGAEGRIMFWMIHASDHERAPALMDAAYSGIGLALPEETGVIQLDLL